MGYKEPDFEKRKSIGCPSIYVVGGIDEKEESVNIFVGI